MKKIINILPDIKLQTINSVSLNKLTLHAGLTEEKSLLEDITIDIPCNETILIKGEHGSGKSIFLKFLAGLYKPASGEYLINMHPMYDMHFDDLLSFRLNIGYVPEYGGLLSDITLYDNLSFPLSYHEIGSTQERKLKVEAAIEYYKLQHIASSFPAELSSSYRRLALIARSLIMNPELLILDNPTDGLYDNDINRIVKKIQHSRDKKILKHLFIVSSDKMFIEKISPTICLKIINKKIEIMDYKNEN